MKVFVSDINFEKDDRSGKCYPWITGRLRSGLEITLNEQQITTLQNKIVQVFKESDIF